MKCPRDNTSLEVVISDEINFHICPNCHGLLLRRESFRRIKKDALVEYPKSQRFHVQFEEGKTLSPYNGKRMRVADYKGVKIDVCPSSNYIWFDHGEFELLRETLRRETKAEGEYDGVAVGSGLAREYIAWFGFDLVFDLIEGIFDSLSSS